jgi:hypothetical protein
MALAPGTRLGSYEVVAQIDAGGMGRMRPAAMDEPGTAARLNSICRSFLRQGAHCVGFGLGDLENGVEFGNL